LGLDLSNPAVAAFEANAGADHDFEFTEPSRRMTGLKVAVNDAEALRGHGGAV
jgi:hypothetical protein